MRRWIALVAAAVLAPALVTTPATAAPRTAPDPVKAVKHQFRPGHGVRITDSGHASLGKQRAIFRGKGVLQFGGSGVVAADLTERVTTQPPPKDGVAVFSQRDIIVNGKGYTSGGVYADRLPEGKTWVRSNFATIGSGGTEQYVNVFDPDILRLLTREANRTASGAGGFQYRGATTGAELYKASRILRGQPGGGADGEERTKIKWRLQLDGRGLPSRLVTESSTEFFGQGAMKLTVDTRYTGWGSKVAITAPPADQVADFKDLDSELEPETPLNILVEGAKND
ncbi:hypothetical protein [Streptosporangium sp. NPDC051022]|uniref:hypothetical protein n=1 Tax=Streptosporangium sp. NPDC051022 TaxID=3155752 RepID=UPI003426B8D7